MRTTNLQIRSDRPHGRSRDDLAKAKPEPFRCGACFYGKGEKPG